MSRPRLFAVILAAGQSRRMGRPKQLLPFGQTTMLGTVIESALVTAPPLEDVILVTNPAVRAALGTQLPPRVRVVLNDEANSPMLASAQLAIRAIESAHRPHDEDAVVILLGDQPQVTAGTIAACAADYAARPGAIVIASYGGRRGHPAVFAWPFIRAITDWPADRRLSEIAAAHPAAVRERGIPTAAPIDVNTPDDYDGLR